MCVCPAEPLSSVSSLEVHFDLLDLTELTDMSDQELAEVFVDSDEENHNEPRAGESDEALLLSFFFNLFLLSLLLPSLLPPIRPSSDLHINFASCACAGFPAAASLQQTSLHHVAASTLCTLSLMLLWSFFPN